MESISDHPSDKMVRIVSFAPEYREAFRSLNEEWILKYFNLETPDRHMLEDPEGYILARGGVILVALEENRPVGVCALVPWHGPEKLFDYELAKMAVAPDARGKGVGETLGHAILEEARKKGAKRIYLETNTVLAPALRLYKRLGFVEIQGIDTPYSRCNTQMEFRF